MTRTLLIDGDIIAYQMASSGEKAIDWGDDLWTLHADAKAVKANVDHWIDWIVDALEADAVKIALTHPVNFRKAILPSYKENRSGVRKPMCLGAVREHLLENREATMKEDLEGDDVLGIWATSAAAVPGEKIIVSIDKDLAGIPGKLLNLDAARKRMAAKEIGSLVEGIVEIAEHDADYYHLTQTLTGDTTDNYTGCPGVGPKGAEKILFGASPPYGSLAEAWAAVVAAFEKAKFGPEYALTQAQVARICRRTDYDFINKRPIPWQPPV